ncbi:hypothetical protein DSO57_1026458 [Entomophthora muscae]|uniref:Uncharacterized protein n=1 Tax=Entomophthora muscae TaxID=34485 RepID=A0ACC2T248_9FUNG|nr:hypothetical protein DSO57_1026458 [Entomophthora muscae]
MEAPPTPKPDHLHLRSNSSHSQPICRHHLHYLGWVSQHYGSSCRTLGLSRPISILSPQVSTPSMVGSTLLPTEQVGIQGQQTSPLGCDDAKKVQSPKKESFYDTSDTGGPILREPANV